ncbi:MAG TPA: sensor histidine kinase [Mycobacteriales bacterium]
MSRRRPTTPVAVWLATGATATVLAVLGAVTAVLAVDGVRSVEVVAVGIGLLVGLVAIGLQIAGARRVTAGLRTLHADAVRRLKDPSLRAEGPPDALLAATELADLARVLDALHLRARVADEVAEQSRRAAEHAGAGGVALRSGLVAAEEATRGQLSAELHDTVAQSLAVARQMLGDGAGQGAEDRLARVGELVEDAEEQVRAVMARTRPAELRSGDLASAVGALRKEFAVRYLVTVRLSWPTQPHPLPLVSAVTVYRFFQEALLNVVKHADVDVATASLAVDGDQVVAEVLDEGPGFVPSEVHSEGGRHVGLGLLRERARLAGGSLEVVTAPGEGTRLTLRLPLAPRTALGRLLDPGGAGRPAVPTTSEPERAPA